METGVLSFEFIIWVLGFYLMGLAFGLLGWDSLLCLRWLFTAYVYVFIMLNHAIHDGCM